MFYVYKVQFPELNAVYIGCTNNIRRRKNQHNENARSGKSYFGSFLAEQGIKLSEEDMQVIAEYENRKDALNHEREATISLKGTGVHMLNDINSDHSTRKGLKGMSNPFAKEYVVIDVIEHKACVVRDMHGWCDKHPEVSYKTLVGTAKRKPLLHHGRYMVRHLDEWDAMSIDECLDLLSGAWYEKQREANEANRIAKLSKTYLLKTPNGFMFVRNLEKFARDHHINPGNLNASFTTGRSAQGYKVVERFA